MEDVVEMYTYITTLLPNQTVIMVGHSMGGALAAKSANHLLTLPIGDKV